MTFNSLAFLIFLPVVLAVWRVLPPKYRWAELLLASYVFYAWFDALLLIPILAITLISYAAARGMGSVRSDGKRKALLFCTLAVCLGTLVAFKYLNFIVGLGYSIARLFGSDARFGGFDIILPMGISFYTFQTLSYVIDVYRGTVQAEKHYGYYSLFVVFFPQLVAGPIERPQNLIPQLKNAQNSSGNDIALGVRKLATGFVKKIVIADFVARFVDGAYSSSAAGGTAYAIATALFAVQIYCDFSGYTDIAIGSARLMGIRLSENFDRPYSSISIREFWRRWHISLSSWFSDYLYKPLGGSRKGLFIQCVNIFIVFLCSGLWHGASLNFAVWGMLHGLFLIINTLYNAVKSKSVALERAAERGWYKIAAHALTLFAVWFAWIFFRAQTLTAACAIVRDIFTDISFDAAVLTGLGIKSVELPFLFASLVLLSVIDDMPVINVRALPLGGATKQSGAALTYFAAAAAVAVLWLAALEYGNAGGFIYFRF